MDASLREALTQTIHRSAIKSFKDYYKITNGEGWIWNTPEYWYSARIAEAIGKNFSPKLTPLLEGSVSDFRSYAATGKKGRPQKKYRSNGRADITLWTYWKTEKEWTARAIIEVKKGWGFIKGPHGSDLNRIGASLKGTSRKSGQGTVEAGFFVFMTDDWGNTEKEVRGKLDAKAKDMNNKIQLYMDENFGKIRSSYSRKFSPFYSEDSSLAACFVFELNVDERRSKK